MKINPCANHFLIIGSRFSLIEEILPHRNKIDYSRWENQLPHWNSAEEAVATVRRRSRIVHDVRPFPASIQWNC